MELWQQNNNKKQIIWIDFLFSLNFAILTNKNFRFLFFLYRPYFHFNDWSIFNRINRSKIFDSIKKKQRKIRANFFLLETYFLSSCLPYYYYFSGFLFCFFGGKRVKQKHSLYSAHTKTFCLICHFRLLIC